MSEHEKKIVDRYATMISALSKEAKQELIAVISKSLNGTNDSTKKTPSSFDGFIPEKSAEKIIADLRNSRHFREKDLRF